MKTLLLDHDRSTLPASSRELQIPREAMGRGDLKFLAAIGAFLGWRAVLFSVFAGSLLGSLVGLATLVIGKRVWSAKLPFGPYLAAGALDLDVFRRRAYRQIFFDAQPLTSRVSSPELDRADDVHGQSGKASPRQT